MRENIAKIPRKCLFVFSVEALESLVGFFLALDFQLGGVTLVLEVESPAGWGHTSAGGGVSRPAGWGHTSAGGGVSSWVGHCIIMLCKPEYPQQRDRGAPPPPHTHTHTHIG